MARIAIEFFPNNQLTGCKIERRQPKNERGGGEYVPRLVILFRVIKIHSNIKKKKTGISQVQKPSYSAKT